MLPRTDYIFGQHRADVDYSPTRGVGDDSCRVKDDDRRREGGQGVQGDDRERAETVPCQV